MRARDLGVVIGEHPPGPDNAITDVAGVRVGHTTLQADGASAVRTGVTVVVPHDDIWTEPVFAGSHRLNGSGEMTGLDWIRESGELTTAIGLTNTHSVGVVRDELVAAQVRARGEGLYWSLPVVGETYDGLLNDINGFHVRPDHVRAALDQATDAPPAEGNVGGGTGMICHGFKGGIGTASRVTDTATGRYTVGVLVQANFGGARQLTIAGVPVGRELLGTRLAATTGSPGQPDRGSIIIVVATDAPVLPQQLKRIARRAALGVARTGGTASNGSGDIFVAFSTANEGAASARPTAEVTLLSNSQISVLFQATVEATEEAIVNAMVAAETMVGRDGNRSEALPHDQLQEVLRRYNRLEP